MRYLELVSMPVIKYWLPCLEGVGNGPHMSLLSASSVLYRCFFLLWRAGWSFAFAQLVHVILGVSWHGLWRVLV